MKERWGILFTVYLSLLLDYIEIAFHTLLALLLSVKPAPPVNKQGAAVLITGASSGIGRHMVELFLSRGYTVFGTVRKQEDGTALELLSGSKGTVHAVLMDVRDVEQCEKAVVTVRERLQRDGLHLHAVINNAGVIPTALAVVASDKLFRDTMEINFVAPFRLARLFLPLLRQAPGGRIVTIGSSSAWITGWLMAAYGGSKGALFSAYKALHMECYTLGIPVSLITPGYIRSRLCENCTIEPKPLFQDENYSFTEEDVGSEIYQKVEKLTKAAWGRTRGLLDGSESPGWVLDVGLIHAIEGRYPLLYYRLGFDSKMTKFLDTLLTDNTKAFLFAKWLESVYRGADE